MKYVIRFTPCPTSYNTPIEISTPSLSDALEMDSLGRPLVKGCTRSHVVDEVYVETDTEKLVHFKDRGYSKPHISDHFKASVKPQKREVLT